ncbi:MAG: ABC transporter ATP-binding protein [Bacteroides sp.]|nr:ABC transporter ATP-binding protein [Bacteroides sp.]MCM1413689.1 ABC transporter ATP-binding protein [Bacteroides sp.]MCM1471868.1 ABC transporter ATP-binding protein [Bacteroides sp.]
MITLNNLGYKYHNGAVALVNVNAEIGPGIHLLLGENGSGKTTLLHIIAGLRLAQPQCACLIDDVATTLRLPSVLQKVAILTDNMKFPFSTINQMARYHAPFYPNFSETVLRENLSRFNMTGDEPINKFSLGNAKKAQLAYMVSLRPDILLFDEPLNGLDISARSEFVRILAENATDNQTVIVSSHTVHDFSNMIDNVILISHGLLTLNMPIWMITDRLSFVSSPLPPVDAIYTRQNLGSFNSIVPNRGSESTDIDLILLYSALQSDTRNKILSILHPEMQ